MRILFLGLVLASVASGPQVLHVFPTPGPKTVTLTVCNASRQCSTTSRTLTVLDPKPAISGLSVPLKIGSAEPSVSLSASLSGKPPILSIWTLIGPLATSTLSGNPVQWAPNALGSHQVRLQASGAGIAFGGPVAVTVVPSSFSDVSPTHWAWSSVEILFGNGITSGCGPRAFCPESNVTREQIAVLLERSFRGSSYTPPPATGIFSDVPRTAAAAPYVEQLFRDGITSGCSLVPLAFCPSAPVSRDQIAILLLKARHGAQYAPPPATGTVFDDVPASRFAAAWIERLAAEGITSGCGPRLYCPSSPVTRAQAAGFLVRTFSLTHKPNPILFLAEGCGPGSCGFPAGLPLEFAFRVTGGLADTYEYDWNGDGTYEEVSPIPVAFHTYTLTGTYTPRVRLRAGAWTATLAHPALSVRFSDSGQTPAAPSNLTATLLGTVPPGAQDPPGALWRTSFALRATSQRQTGYVAFFSVGSSPFRPVAVLPGDLSEPLLVPPAPQGSIARIYLVPFNSASFGPASSILTLPSP